jgi:hypothetical protein
MESLKPNKQAIPTGVQGGVKRYYPSLGIWQSKHML